VNTYNITFANCRNFNQTVNGKIDAPGALYHVIIRGIERRKIFRSDYDRKNFVSRLSKLIPETQTDCFAWALIPNHAHLLLRTGTVPISLVMRRLLTGYSGWFNKNYKRHGQLFQNRYKSILCQEDPYLKEFPSENGAFLLTRRCAVKFNPRNSNNMPPVKFAIAPRFRRKSLDSGWKLDRKNEIPKIPCAMPAKISFAERSVNTYKRFCIKTTLLIIQFRQFLLIRPEFC